MGRRVVVGRKVVVGKKVVERRLPLSRLRAYPPSVYFSSMAYLTRMSHPPSPLPLPLHPGQRLNHHQHHY